MYTIELFTPVSIDRILRKVLSDEAKGIAWLDTNYPGINFLVERETVFRYGESYEIKTVFTFYDPEIAVHFKLAFTQ